jgi:LysM repeat protein
MAHAAYVRVLRAAITLGMAGMLTSIAGCTRPGSAGDPTPSATSAVRITASPSPARRLSPVASPSPQTAATASAPSVSPTGAPTPSPTRVTGTVPGQKYVVEPGDTLVAIAEEFGVTVQELIDANRLDNPDVLRVGQELIIPGR